MKQTRLPLLLALIAILLLTACQQDDATGGTVTPPTVPAPTGEVGELAYPAPARPAPDAAYPAPDAAYPAPEEDGDGGATQPTPPDPAPGGSAGDGDAQPGEPPVPVEPEIRAAAGSAQPLPESVLLTLPAGGPGMTTPGTTLQHTVADGDWLLQVARCYGTSAAAIRTANNLPNPDYLTPGTTLTVPDAGSEGPVSGPPCVATHQVGEGETWESIAATYQTTAAVLQRANPGPLTAGRELFVPAPAGGTPAETPPASNHLLFIRDGDLAIWRATDGRVEVVVDDTARVLDLATNLDGRYVLARQTRDGGATSEVVLIDTESRTSLLLEAGLLPHEPAPDGVETLLISPDGGWGVYPAADADGYRLVSFQTAAPETLYAGPVIPIGGPDDRSPYQLFAGPDEIHFLVSSGEGLHEFPYSLDLTGRQLVGLSGNPQTDPALALFAQAWDGSGRYLLAVGSFLEGGAYFVLDSETGAIAQAPGSTGYIIVPAASWTPDGQVLVVQPGETGSTGPLATAYSLSYDGDGLTLTSGERSTLALLAEPRLTGPEPGTAILLPSLLPADGSLLMGIQSGLENERGVWEALDPTSELLSLTSPLPIGVYQLIWPWDYSGAVAVARGGMDAPDQVSYLDLRDDEPPFELSASVGGSLSDFHWLRPR